MRFLNDEEAEFAKLIRSIRPDVRPRRGFKRRLWLRLLAQIEAKHQPSHGSRRSRSDCPVSRQGSQQVILPRLRTLEGPGLLLPRRGGLMRMVSFAPGNGNETYEFWVNSRVVLPLPPTVSRDMRVGRPPHTPPTSRSSLS